MISFFIGLILFFVNMAIRVSIATLNITIKTAENINKFKATGGNTFDGILRKRKKLEEIKNMPKDKQTRYIKYLVLRRIRKALKGVLNFFSWLIKFLFALSCSVFVVQIACVVILAVSAGSVVTVVLGDGIHFSGTVSDTQEGGNTGNSDKQSFKNNQELWIHCVKETQKRIAKYKFTYSNPSNPYYTPKTVPDLGTWIRPDCSGVVYACAQQYGAYELYPDGPPATIFGSSTQVASMTGTGFFEVANVASGDQLVAGDIVVLAGSHTQIYMGDGLWVNGGNTQDLGEPDPVPQKMYFPAGCQVLRVKEGVKPNPRL